MWFWIYIKIKTKWYCSISNRLRFFLLSRFLFGLSHFFLSFDIISVCNITNSKSGWVCLVVIFLREPSKRCWQRFRTVVFGCYSTERHVPFWNCVQLCKHSYETDDQPTNKGVDHHSTVYLMWFCVIKIYCIRRIFFWLIFGCLFFGVIFFSFRSDVFHSIRTTLVSPLWSTKEYTNTTLKH